MGLLLFWNGASGGSSTNAQAELASATGTAYNASVKVETTGGLVSATGAASAPTPSVAPSAQY